MITITENYIKSLQDQLDKALEEKNKYRIALTCMVKEEECSIKAKLYIDNLLKQYS